MKELVYVRTDRNGTKYYHDFNCPRCGGAGYADKWRATGSYCYACGGSGERNTPKVIKEYTPEYEEKLRARRAEKQAQKQPDAEEIAELKKRSEDARRRLWESEGLSSNGKGYIYDGNTYPVKELIKAAGGRWQTWAWIAPERIDAPKGVKIYNVTANDICSDGGYINIYKLDEFLLAHR